MKNLYPLALAFIVAIPALAIERTVIDLNPILKSRLSSNKEISKKITTEADKLLTSYSFMFANEVYEIAVRHDSENFKAQMMLHLLKPMMHMKGILKRIEPAALTFKGFERRRADYLASDTTSAKDFYMDGQPDIRDEDDLRTKFLMPLLNDMDKWHQYMTANRDKTFEVHSYKDDLMDWNRAQSCTAKKVKENVYELSKCPHLKPKTMRVDEADLHSLKTLVLYAHAIYGLPASYALNGILDVARDPKSFSIPQETIEYLKNVPGFGEIKDKTAMQRVPGLGIEFLVDYDILAQKDGLCGQNGEPAKGREDHISKSSCYTRRGTYKQLDKYLRDLEDTFKVKAIEEVVESELYGKYKTNVNYMALYARPVKDLKMLLPTKFNACGNPANIGDEKGGGMFPNGDGTKYLILREQINLPCL
jgi:hypothetical protein